MPSEQSPCFGPSNVSQHFEKKLRGEPAMKTRTNEIRANLLRGAGLSALLTAFLWQPAWGQDNQTTDIGTIDKETVEKVFPVKRPYSPWAARNFPTRPLFGDTHLHTSFSFDAGAFGARL